MGLYDTISIWMACPYCGELNVIDAQTKDLGQMMFSYRPLHSDWETNKLEKPFRKKMPVFPSFPLDKVVWKTQAEQTEANATVPPEFKKLKFIEVTATCNSVKCQFDADRRDIIRQGCTSGFGRLFEGKVKIVKGKLVGPIYDIVKDGLTEQKLEKYKDKDKKLFNSLMKKYKHEILVARHFFPLQVKRCESKRKQRNKKS